MPDEQTASTTSQTAATTSEAAAATAAATTSADQQTAAAAKWYEGLANKDMAADKGLQRYETVEALATGYKNLEKRFGVPENRRIDLPEDLTNAEAMKPVWQRLGTPDKIEGYADAGMKLPDGASESDKKTLSSFTEAMFKAGVPAQHAKAMFDAWAAQGAARVAADAAAAETRKTEGAALLKTEFGAAHDQRVKEITTLLSRVDPKGESGLTADNLTTYPKMALMLARMVERMQEPNPGVITGDAAVGDRALSPAQAKAAIAALSSDPIKGKALTDRDHPMHKAVVDERRRLLAMSEGREVPA